MWVKICGVTTVESARVVAEAGADAVGLNFYAGSKRCVSAETAAHIANDVGSRLQTVGVFVNHGVEEIAQLVDDCGLDLVQLHGDESPEFAAELAGRLSGVGLLRALRFGAAGLESVDAWLDECGRLGVDLFACLVDSAVSGQYGGTGRTVAWDRLAEEWHASGTDRPRLVLAGGLTPDNVARAVRACRPWGVDTASGVETAPGQKDGSRCEAFVEQART